MLHFCLELGGLCTRGTRDFAHKAHPIVTPLVRFPAGHHCATTSGKLFTPVCLCHQAVSFGGGSTGQGR